MESSTHTMAQKSHGKYWVSINKLAEYEEDFFVRKVIAKCLDVDRE